MGKQDYSKIDFEHKTIKEISEETGISYDALICYCKKMNIDFKRGRKGVDPKRDYFNIINCSGIDFKNKTLLEISEEIGIPYKTLHKYCKRMNVEFKHDKRGRLRKSYTVGCNVMKTILCQTFGRVDGIKYIDEIANYEYEDNWSNRIIYAVLKQNNEKYTIARQFLTDDPNPEAEWPKISVMAKDIVDESEAITKCEEMFNSI